MHKHSDRSRGFGTEWFLWRIWFVPCWLLRKTSRMWGIIQGVWMISFYFYWSGVEECWHVYSFLAQRWSFLHPHWFWNHPHRSPKPKLALWAAICMICVKCRWGDPRKKEGPWNQKPTNVANDTISLTLKGVIFSTQDVCVSSLSATHCREHEIKRLVGTARQPAANVFQVFWRKLLSDTCTTRFVNAVYTPIRQDQKSCHWVLRLWTNSLFKTAVTLQASSGSSSKRLSCEVLISWDSNRQWACILVLILSSLCWMDEKMQITVLLYHLPLETVSWQQKLEFTRTRKPQTKHG